MLGMSENRVRLGMARVDQGAPRDMSPAPARSPRDPERLALRGDSAITLRAE
jgi:hypothetical protein